MSGTSIDWRPLVEVVNRSRLLVLTTHAAPDGDAVGSEIALARHLGRLGRDVRVVNPSEIEPRLSFIAEGVSVEVYEPSLHDAVLSEADAIFVLDLSQWGLLGDLAEPIRQGRARRVVIDHHGSPSDLGEIAAIDPTASSTGELVHDFLLALGGEIDGPTAACLFAAVATDTGWFRFQRTGPEVFLAAAELMTKGVHPYSLYSRLYEAREWKKLLAIREALDRVEPRLGGQAAFLTLDRSAFERVAPDSLDTEALLDFGLSVREVEVSALLRDAGPGKTKVHLRSKGRVDVRQVAARLGGGGHHNAAGAVIELPLQAAAAALERELAPMLLALRDSSA
ncbi:MAG: DHH family phosphoesterase [Planctomycetes bacterium]|nr:DHH family phosphoesterase [Planctomycetota bacterium]